MCGIFGIAGRQDHAGLRQAALTLRHRGPDGFSDWSAPGREAYLAHCRLAIIDLSDAGRQPMANGDGSIQLVFNGEIYNFRELRLELEAAGYQFRSHTDSEVIVHGYQHWGDAVVARLRGIFAFAIWDQARNRLLLARDRLGVKPLYYALRGGELGFASEARALLQVMPDLRMANPDAVAQFLQGAFIHGSHSIWRGMSRLPPATVLAFDVSRGVARMWRYWAKPEQAASSDIVAATEELEHLLDAAVREELVADVPVGCFLSGGLDSSLVTSFAAQHSPRIRSYFADFPGWEGSERDDARLAAGHLGTTHQVEAIEGFGLRGGDEEGADVFDAFDEPIGDLAIVPSWHLSKAIRRHVKVALSGDGGDELFAGYRRYGMIEPSPRRRLAWFVEGMRRKLSIGRHWPEGCADASEYFRFLMCPGFSVSEMGQLFPQWRQELAAASLDAFHGTSRAHWQTREWQFHDIDTYLVDNNLARMDRCSMAHGLEVRVPVLDHRVVELALSLPGDLNPAANGGKRLLREIAKRRLPAALLDKKKQGFSFPLQRYISSQQMAQGVVDGSLVESGLVERKALQAWLAAASGGNHPLKLWLLYVLEQWASRWLIPNRATRT